MTLQSFTPNESIIQNQLDFIYCEYPSYVNGTTGQTCNIVEHDDPYADDEIVFWNFNVTNIFFSGSNAFVWKFAIPTGQITHAWDSMASGLGRLYNIGVLILAVLFPIGDLSALLGVAVVGAIIGLLAILYIVIGFSIYKLVLPFV